LHHGPGVHYPAAARRIAAAVLVGRVSLAPGDDDAAGRRRRAASQRQAARAVRARTDAEKDEAEQQEQDREEGHRPWMLRRSQHPVEQREGAGLVQRLVQVAALRALDARRAAALARA